MKHKYIIIISIILLILVIGLSFGQLGISKFKATWYPDETYVKMEYNENDFISNEWCDVQRGVNGVYIMNLHRGFNENLTREHVTRWKNRCLTGTESIPTTTLINKDPIVLEEIK